MKPATAPSALKIQALLGEDFRVLEFSESTRTAADAAAAGTPNAVFRLRPDDLVRLTGGILAPIAA
jgi:hypothetical protein